MALVDVIAVPGGTLVLRARGSELLILPHHIAELKGRKAPKDFTQYFLQDALINRPARKLFEAWLRKDHDLWKRVYHAVQNEVQLEDEPTEVSVSAAKPEKAAKQDAAKEVAKVKKAEQKVDEDAAKATSTSPKAKAKTAPKEASEEAAAKSEKKAATKKKTVTKQPASGAKKATTKKVTKTASKKTSTTVAATTKKKAATTKTTKAKKKA